MLDIEKIQLSLSERMLIRKIRRKGISKLDKRVNWKQFQALKMYKIVRECMNDAYQKTPLDEYGNETLNAYEVVPEVSRYFIYHRKMFWMNFRSWAALVISLVSIAVSVLT